MNSTHIERDYAGDRRLILLAAIAMAIAVASTLAAALLIGLTRFFTHLFFFQTLSLADRSPSQRRRCCRFC